MALLLFYGFVSIFFSFLCSILEAVLLSVSPTFINVKKKEGKSFAKDLENLKKDVDKPLIAILTLNTIAHTVGAILVGNQAGAIFGGGGGDPHGASILSPVGIISVIMTLLILVVSEIIPKTIGATYWKKLAGFSTRTLNLMVLSLKYTGLLWVLQLFTKLVGSKGHEGPVLTREDLGVMAQTANQSGELEKREYDIIKNLLTFDEIVAEDIMTPRSVIVMADEDMTLQEYYDNTNKFVFSRIPLYAGDTDNLTGIFIKDDLLQNLIKGKNDLKLSDIKREVTNVKADTPLPSLFEKLSKKRVHLAVVTDEYGSIQGLVTLEDIMETIFGLEIMDETDDVSDLQAYARQSWEKRAKKRGLIE